MPRGRVPQLERVPADARRLPRTAHRQHRHRLEQHRGDDADRSAVAAVATAGDRAADAAERTAADQRAAGTEGAAARRTERRSRAEERGNRTGPPRARRQGGGTGADLQVQVGVPREHVARVAHAAQKHPDSRSAAERQPRKEPQWKQVEFAAPFMRPAPTC